MRWYAMVHVSVHGDLLCLARIPEHRNHREGWVSANVAHRLHGIDSAVGVQA
jgi:hypothetical protein